MALPSPIGDSARPGFLSLPQWGVRGSLFAAFAVIAGLAILISAGAGMVLGHLGGTMIELSGRASRGLRPACSFRRRARVLPARDRRCLRRGAKRR
jgi:hypothetical protein